MNLLSTFLEQRRLFKQSILQLSEDVLKNRLDLKQKEMFESISNARLGIFLDKNCTICKGKEKL